MAESEEREGPAAAQGAGGESPPSEEELRAQLEDEIRKVRVEDVVLQGAVSILNLAARRIAKDDERDLAQARVGIDAARALIDLVPEQAQPQLRQAVAELQVMYAKHAGEGPAGGSGGENGPADEPPPTPKPEETQQQGGSSKLWTPHSRD